MLLLYEGFHSISKCMVDVFGKIVLATQIDFDDNPGTSITNAAETIAKTVCDEYKIPYEELIFIEHYKNDHYSLVNFEIKNNVFTNPKWGKITLNEIADLIKNNLTVNELDKFIVDNKKKLDKTYKDRMELLEDICPHTHSIKSDFDNKKHCFACGAILE